MSQLSEFQNLKLKEVCEEKSLETVGGKESQLIGRADYNIQIETRDVIEQEYISPIEEYEREFKYIRSSLGLGVIIDDNPVLEKYMPRDLGNITTTINNQLAPNYDLNYKVGDLEVIEIQKQNTKRIRGPYKKKDKKLPEMVNPHPKYENLEKYNNPAYKFKINS